MSPSLKLNLRRLHRGIRPGITPASGRMMAQCCAVRLEDEGHGQGCTLRIDADHSHFFVVYWLHATEWMRNDHNEPEVAAEYGAIGIASLLLQDLEACTIVQRERRRDGRGFDYWVGDADDPLFQKKARLEVKGMNVGDDSRIHDRINRAIAQTAKSDHTGLPKYIVIVHFGRSIGRLLKMT